MKKTLNRTLSLVLALVLAVSLALPAAAADKPVTLDKSEVSLAPKQTVTVTATLSEENQGKTIEWKSLDKTIAEVTAKNGTATITAKKKGSTAITATVNGYTAVCNLTVEDDYVTDVLLTPAGPETIPVGKTRQLKAEVKYAYGSQGDQSVTWTSNKPAVATVSDKGLVTAVAEGSAEIVALSKGESATGTPVMKAYQLTVTKAGASSVGDTLVLSRTTAAVNSGLYVDTPLQPPQVAVRNDAVEVTSGYTFTYRWTDSANKELGTEKILTIQPASLADFTVTCTVTATSKTDSTQVLTGTCTYNVKVYPGTSVGAVTTLSQGAATLDKLMNQEGKLSVLDQLTKGDGTDFAPAIPSLSHVVFEMPTAMNVEVGSLSARDQIPYYLSSQADGNHLDQVAFTPRTQGTYSVGFFAYGDKTYYGRLEIIVTDQTVTPPAETDRQCNATGFTFAVTDFFHSSDADPVASVVFGTPTAGKLVRDLDRGSGTPDKGDRYYTNSASKGDFHVSTLSYLPNAGFTGTDTIPVTLTTQSGKVTAGALSVYVTGKTHSEHFTDVTEADVGSWAANAVDFAYDFSLVNGMEPNKFYPNSTMTRAQLVTILYRAAGSPELAVTTNFEDLNVGAYYYNAVVWANVSGVVNGTSDRTFSPDALITREQIATILYRYAETTGGDTSAIATALNGYADKGKVSSWATNAMTWAVSHGIISGVTDNTLSPLSSATRAQVVVMLHRYLTD